jgi:hypothetical protein
MTIIPEDTNIIPDDGDFAVAIPEFTLDEVLCGFVIEPVVGWLVEGHPDSGQIIPLTQCGDDNVISPGDVYAIQHPDGSFRFPDGERCGEDDLLDCFKKRCGQIRNDG